MMEQMKMLDGLARATEVIGDIQAENDRLQAEVDDLNEQVRIGGYKDLIQLSEALHEKKIAEIADMIKEQEREAEIDYVLDQVDSHFQKTEGVESVFKPMGKDSVCGIIFSNTKNGRRNSCASCEGVLAHLKKREIAADSYHGDREDERPRIQERFLDNQFTVICATKAFGMGVNKKNVRYTIHNGLPWSIEAFYQEAGRAGRDPARNASECYIRLKWKRQ